MKIEGDKYYKLLNATSTYYIVKYYQDIYDTNIKWNDACDKVNNCIGYEFPVYYNLNYIIDKESNDFIISFLKYNNIDNILIINE